ncbi:MAG: hypothetical protein HOV83_03940 [Catenulispora sp.]|nr:hypothetical protein [Catenulispora sp.]
MPKIRTTFDGQELEVSEEEALDLTRMGVVLDTKAQTDEGARKAAEKSTTPDESPEG